MIGVYAYTLKDTGEVIYVGVDSHIESAKRHNDHLERKTQQAINIFIAKNKSWDYVVLAKGFLNKQLAHEFESHLISKYKPAFNVKGGN